MFFTDLPPTSAILRMANFSLLAFAIHAAAELGIADLLAGGPKRAGDRARATNTHPDSLYGLLRALATFGVFAEDEDGRFALTPRSETLRSDVPGSVRNAVLHIGSPEMVGARAGLLSSLRTDKPAFNAQHDGLSWWDYPARNPEADALFNRSMTALSQRARVIAGKYDFGQFDTIVDIGGGEGALLAAILEAHPTVRVVLFDLPHVVARALPRLEESGLRERCEVVAGSFFDSVPPGGDAYILRSILHDWNDDDARRILETCHRAMTSASRLLLLEFVVQPSSEPAWQNIQDLSMMVLLGGRERTAEDFRNLLASTGFALTNILPTSFDHGIVEAIPS